MRIESASNEKIKHIRKLHRKAYRSACGEFLLEGERACCDAAESGLITSVFIEEDYDGALPNGEVPVYEVKKSVFRELGDTMNPQGILAIARMKKVSLSDFGNNREGVVMVCENVTDPGNLGTIIRTAAAVGANGVVLSQGCVDLYNEKVVRATMSTLFTLPILVDADLSEVLPCLKEKGYPVYGTYVKNDAKELYDVNLSGKAAFVLGNEANGMTAETAALADACITIPMAGQTESLNVSVAGGVLLYEHYRQNKK